MEPDYCTGPFSSVWRYKTVLRVVVVFLLLCFIKFVVFSLSFSHFMMEHSHATTLITRQWQSFRVYTHWLYITVVCMLVEYFLACSFSFSHWFYYRLLTLVLPVSHFFLCSLFISTSPPTLSSLLSMPRSLFLYFPPPPTLASIPRRVNCRYKMALRSPDIYHKPKKTSSFHTLDYAIKQANTICVQFINIENILWERKRQKWN